MPFLYQICVNSETQLSVLEILCLCVLAITRKMWKSGCSEEKQLNQIIKLMKKMKK